MLSCVDVDGRILFNVPFQIIYGYVETEESKNDEIDRNPSFILRVRVLLHHTSHKHGMRWMRL